MSSMISEALDFMQDEAADYLEEAVTYSDGSHSVSVGAVVLPTKQPDSSLLALAQGPMTAITPHPANQDYDFSILASVLILNSVAVLPQSGHTITWLGKIYEVTTPQNGPYIYESTDGNRRLRIHTKYLRASP